LLQQFGILQSVFCFLLNIAVYERQRIMAGSCASLLGECAFQSLQNTDNYCTNANKVSKGHHFEKLHNEKSDFYFESIISRAFD
jgi:hypothetical protein